MFKKSVRDHGEELFGPVAGSAISKYVDDDTVHIHVYSEEEIEALATMLVIDEMVTNSLEIPECVDIVNEELPISYMRSDIISNVKKLQKK